MAKLKVDDIIKKIDNLPTLPVISQQIQELFRNDDVNIRDLKKLVEQDAPLATKLLRIVNSSFYGLINKTSSLEHALVILGMKEVKNIVLGFSIQSYFNTDSTNIDRNRFWKHSIVCSQVAKFLGNYYNVSGSETLFLSGLIHDMGKLVFDQYFHEEFIKIIDMVTTKKTACSKAEKDILGVTHYQVAAKILQQWHFPKDITMQVFYHHAPWHDDNYTTGSIILYLSDIITRISGYTCIENEKQAELNDLFNPAVINFLEKNGFDLDESSFDKLITSINVHLSEESDNVLTLFD